MHEDLFFRFGHTIFKIVQKRTLLKVIRPGPMSSRRNLGFCKELIDTQQTLHYILTACPRLSDSKQASSAF